MPPTDSIWFRSSELQRRGNHQNGLDDWQRHMARRTVFSVFIRKSIWLAQTLQFVPQSLRTALHQCLLSAQVGAFCFGLHMRSLPHKFLILHLTEIRIAKMIHTPCTFNLSKMSHVWFTALSPFSAKPALTSARRHNKGLGHMRTYTRRFLLQQQSVSRTISPRGGESGWTQHGGKQFIYCCVGHGPAHFPNLPHLILPLNQCLCHWASIIFYSTVRTATFIPWRFSHVEVCIYRHMDFHCRSKNQVRISTPTDLTI